MKTHAIPVVGLAAVAAAATAAVAITATDKTSSSVQTPPPADPCNGWPPQPVCIPPGWKIVGPDGTTYVHH